MESKDQSKREEECITFEEEYEELKKKYSLPSFVSLAKDFDIEKIQEKETLFLVREVRRTMNEKITAYIHLFETLINPASPPMFVFRILKNMSEKEKEKMQEFYKKLSRMQLEVMKLDTIYSEQDEAKFVRKTFQIWQQMKREIHSLFSSFEKNFEKNGIEAGRSYFD